MPALAPRPGFALRASARLAVVIAIIAGPAAAAQARTAAGFFIDGAGDGHGIGMSQYGALGYALHGASYRQILTHYYAQTTLGTVAPGHDVTVLLHTGAAAFSGAAHANDPEPLDPATTYGVAIKGADLELTVHGHRVMTVAPPLTVSGPGPLHLVGFGDYAGSLIFRPTASGKIETVNELDLDDYVRGVISAEMPAGWPPAALEAQAVAARTYALTDQPVNPDYDVYDDTRSQMYGGVAAETASTDAAVAATANQVVEYAGSPVTTYFFASSGGYTEDIQNVWVGVTPEAWLQGVPDPYDDSGANPFYRWKVTMTLRAAARRLRGLVKGSFLGIRILKRGVSPRVVEAAVVGSRGSTAVTGVQLEKALGLKSTYMSFTTITATGTGKTQPGSGPGGAGASGSGDTASSSGTSSSSGTTSSSGTKSSSGSSSSSGTSSATGGPPPTSTPAPEGSTGGIPVTNDVLSASDPWIDVHGAAGGLRSAGAAPVRAVAQPFVPARAATGALVPAHTRITGTVFPPAAGATVVIERRRGHGFVAVARGRTSATGAYGVRVPGRGRYRVLFGANAGPVVSVS